MQIAGINIQERSTSGEAVILSNGKKFQRLGLDLEIKLPER